MRPSLHFTPTSGWMNDPHGITARDGGYDTFFQHVPNQTEWAPNCHWGHATGPDLLTLREQVVAIAPGDGDDGIWTGCIVEDRGDARAFYTAVSTPEFGIGRIRTAVPVDASWTEWRKGEVVVQAPAELDLVAYRDPFIRREGDQWRMFVGAAGRDGTAMALTYTTKDLTTWEYDGIALERNTAERTPVWMGALWECPQVFELDGHAVMVSSVWEADALHYAGYALGSFGLGRFIADTWDRLTWGTSLYAPSLFTDLDGEFALTFWLRGIGGKGWEGAHSLPYRLNISNGGRLSAQPHPDVASHRTQRYDDGAVPGLAVDIEWTTTEDGTLTITSDSRVVVALTHSHGEMLATTPAAHETFPAAGPMRVILDGPVLEISSDAGIFATPVRPQGAELQVKTTAGELNVFGLA